MEETENSHTGIEASSLKKKLASIVQLQSIYTNAHVGIRQEELEAFVIILNWLNQYMSPEKMTLYHPLKLKKEFLSSKKPKYLLLDKQRSILSPFPLLFENLLEDFQILWD